MDACNSKGVAFEFNIKAKVFRWRVIVGGLPLGDALGRRRIANYTCFF